MRFLIAFAAVLGYASAGLIAPVLGYASAGLTPLVDFANAGDTEAAIINANVAAENRARAVERRKAIDEDVAWRGRNKAMRDAIDNSRDLQESAYWRSVVDSQNYVAAVQSRAAALSGAAAAVRGAQLSTPELPPVGPLAYAGYGLPAAYGLGPHAW